MDLITPYLQKEAVCHVKLTGIRSLIRVGKARAPLAYSECSTPGHHTTLYLNRFRGEPAMSLIISLSPRRHRSSPPFATGVSSVLQTPVKVSTCPYLDHSVSGLIRVTHRPISDSVSPF